MTNAMPRPSRPQCHEPAPARPKPTHAGPPATEAGGILTIDLAAIDANWRALARRVMPAECAAVVKADGYGCGLEPVAAALARPAARPSSSRIWPKRRRVRAVAPRAAIYMLNGFAAGHRPGLRGHRRCGR